MNNILRGASRSRTVWFNALAGALVALLEGVGVAVPGDVTTAVLTLGNLILRALTHTDLRDK